MGDWRRTSGANVPIPALPMTTILIQITLLSADAFTLTLKLCSALSPIPHVLAAYALKLGARGGTYDTRRRTGRHRNRRPGHAITI
jgi:arginine:ornithine antiporter / lysine permease